MHPSLPLHPLTCGKKGTNTAHVHFAGAGSAIPTEQPAPGGAGLMHLGYTKVMYCQSDSQSETRKWVAINILYQKLCVPGVTDVL